MLKRIVTIQDISCFGKCSSTVALPLISAMGVEAAVIPTAVLSTHQRIHRLYLPGSDSRYPPDRCALERLRSAL
ncbi:MAG: hypothetical protein ACLT3Y_03530 [Ruminococcus callidus]